MIDPKELSELTAYIKHGPIPAEVIKNIPEDCLQIRITNEEYVKASALIMHLQKESRELQEYKDWAEVQLDADREAFSKIDYGQIGRRFVMVNYPGTGGAKLPETFKAHHLGFSRDELGFPVSIFEKEDGTVRYATLDFIQFYDGYAEEEKEEENDNGH